MIRVGLTDDHEVVRRGICEMAAPSHSLEIAHTWSSAAETISGIPAANIKVLLLDINLPDMQGDKLCARIKLHWPSLAIIGLSTFNQSLIVKDLLDAGASGYLTKDASLADLEAAVSAVMQGEQYLSEEIKARFNRMDADSRSVRLTRREEDILKLITQELTTKEIANRLCVSDKTIETHRAHLFQKLGVRNIAGLVREAILRGLVP